MNGKPRTVSGMRPTGPLHLGHYFGVLKNWVELQHTEEAYFFVADWHALTSDYADPSKIRRNIHEMVKDWIGAGLNPEKCVIFRQSHVKQHAELSLLLSMITSVSWLERNPTYKEQQQQISNKALGNAGFLCYPVLMAADILMYRPHGVPVGEDQLPHMELTREIARRFNNFYGELFPEPQAMLTPAAKCPGLDGRKMSKSYNNGIFLSDRMDDITEKVRGMFTDKARLRRADPGNPDVCNLFPYHVLLSSAEGPDPPGLYQRATGLRGLQKNIPQKSRHVPGASAGTSQCRGGPARRCGRNPGARQCPRPRVCGTDHGTGARKNGALM